MRSAIKRCIPPILKDIISKTHPEFDGIYQEYSDVCDENPWADEFWYEISKNKLVMSTSQREILESDYKSQLLLFLNVLPNKKIKILDFSGGTGFIYHMIMPGLLHKENIFWHVADSETLISLGRKYAGNHQISFSAFNFTKYPEIFQSDEKFDILFINTSVQYFPDYQEILQPLLNKKIEWIILTRLLAGDIPQYTTCQTIGRKSTPCTFLNFPELHAFFNRNGYDLVFFSHESLENLSYAYSNTIPHDYRIRYPLNLIFKRVE